MKKIITAIILSFVIITKSFACSCMQEESPTKSLEKSDFVFIGKVNNIESKEVQTDFDFTIREKTVSFDTQNVLKGEKNKALTIKTEDSGAACGYNFKNDKNYIVYGYKDENNGEYRVSLCSRTSLLENANEDKKELATQIENGKIISNYTGKEKNSKRKNNNIIYNAGFIIIIALLLGSIFLKLRK